MPTIAIFLVSLFLSLSISSSVFAKSYQGFIRSVHANGRNFSIFTDQLYRVQYVGAGKPGLQEGDEVQLEGELQSNGILIAKSIQRLQTGKTKSYNPTTHEIQVQLGQEFILAVAQTAILVDGSKKLVFFGKDFINTLCKDGYECDQPGVVGMMIEASQGSKTKQIELVSNNGRKPVDPVIVKIFDYKIQLRECGEDVVSLTVFH